MQIKLDVLSCSVDCYKVLVMKLVFQWDASSTTGILVPSQ